MRPGYVNMLKYKNFMERKVYLDYAATTPVDPRVLKEMLPYFREKFGNSVSLHDFGQEAKKALEKTRAIMATAIKASHAEEIIFTGSATESNNLALKGVAFANQNRGKHIIISAVEHSCVLKSAEWLAQNGFKITKIEVDAQGMVDPKKIARAIKKDTVLVSIIHASNEIGTIQPIAEIGKICRGKNIYFHTDAVQSFGKMPLNVQKIPVDLLTTSSHKIYGPKGAAFLYVRRGVKISPLLHGGGQEFDLRSSTVNIPAIIGFGKAVEICQKEMDREPKRQARMRDRLIHEVLRNIPDAHLNGHPSQRLSNNANFWFAYVEGESIIMDLNSHGIAVSTGSACSSEKLEPSHVLMACGLQPEQAHGSLRVTLGRGTKDADIEYFLRILPQTINRLRKISPYVQ